MRFNIIITRVHAILLILCADNYGMKYATSI